MINSKLKRTFASFGVFVIFAAAVVVFLGIDISQSSVSSSTISELDEKVDKIQVMQKEKQNTIPLPEMECNELRDFIMTFENGWGKAMSEFGNRCDDDDSN